MQSNQNNPSRISLFLAKNVYPWLITLKPEQQKYRATISGLLPETLQQHKDQKQNLDSVLDQWSESSDDDIKIISNLLKKGIKLGERGWLLILITLTILGGSIAGIYFLLQPRIPRDSQCLIGKDCIAIAQGATIEDIDSENLDNSELTIRIVPDANNKANNNDRLAIFHQGTNLENICVMGNQIAYQGVVIARFTGGKGDKPLAITFKIEPSSKTRSNQISDANINSQSESNYSAEKTPENNRCITDGNVDVVPKDITKDIIQAVLNDITYQNTNKSEVGTRQLEIKLADNNGNHQTPTNKLDLALVKEPRSVTIKVPNSQVVKENSLLNINGINISKVGFSDDKNIIAILDSLHGKLAIDNQALNKLKNESANSNANSKDNKIILPEIKIDPKKPKQVILIGTIKSINTLLNQSNAIHYQSDKGFQGGDILSVRVDDGNSPKIEKTDLVYPPNAKLGEVKEEISIRVRPKNAPDILNLSDENKVNEDTELPIRGMKIQDPDSKIIRVDFQVKNGKITVFGGLNSAQVANNGTSTVSLQGSVDKINDSLSVVTYQGAPNFFGTDSLTVTAYDGIHRDDKSINITVKPVNDPPEIRVDNSPKINPTSLSTEHQETRPLDINPSPFPTDSLSNSTNATVSGVPGRKNLRSGFGLEYGVVGNVNTGDRVQVIQTARNSDNFLWHKIYVPQSGVQGWIASNLLSVDGQPQSQTPVQTQPPIQTQSPTSSNETNATVGGSPGTKNIRSGAGTIYGVVGKIRTGDRIQILGTSYDRGGYQWYNIYDPQSGARGWIAAQLISRD
jgi:uncharacterized protein YraI